ncbi:MAG: relaxase, partial [Clostridia bacterium]|nr:relaxase [Clostridia bacterium]
AYDEEALRAVISGSRQKQKQREQPWLRADRKIGLLIDIEAALQAGKGPGFEFWAKRENLKRAAKAVRMLEARGALDQHDLDPIVTKAIQEEKAILDQCQALDDKIAKIRILRQHIFNYSRTRKIAEEYRASGYSKKYAAEHKDELRQYREAKKAFDQLGQEALPKISELQREEHELIVEKQSKYSEYRRAKAISKELQEAKANVEGLLAHQAITADRLVRMERVEKTKY